MADRKQADYSIHNYVQDASASFDEQAFNEIDGLVLTQVSNMNLSGSEIDLYSNTSKTFEEIYKKMSIEGTHAYEAYTHMSSDEKALIFELGNSKRYKDLEVSNFVMNPSKSNIPGFESVGKDQKMEQFAAATITYKQNGETYTYVSYRATDGSSDGWSENLAMLYSMNTQAQADSTVYMNIIGKNTEGNIIGGGHSKGGGDFEYAYLFCDDDVRSKIVKGYVYDNPGLTDEVLSKTDHYQDYKKITNGSFICPQNSIVGQVLHEGDNATFVHSVESGFDEHDPYSWSIDANALTFVYDEQSELSKFLNDALDTSVSNMSLEERKAFFSFISYIFYNSGGDGLDGAGELFREGWKNDDGSINFKKLEEILEVLYKDWENMTPEQKEAFLNSLGGLASGFIATGLEYTGEKIEKWIEEKQKQIEAAIANAWTATKNWALDKREQLRNFLSEVQDAIINGINKVANWFKNFSTGCKYANSNPSIVIDTYKLRSYAQRLQAVNRRISTLDSRLDSLYWSVGLKDLWNLMQADILTGYSWRISKCVSYLNDTANDFDNAENSISGNL